MSYVIKGANDYIAAMTGGVFSRFITFEGSNILQKTPASILAYYIINDLEKMSDPSDGDSWPLFTARLPDGPQVETNCGAVYDTSGIQGSKCMYGTVEVKPGVQLRLRGDDYDECYTKIESIALVLDDVFSVTVTIGSSIYLIQNINRTTPIVYIGTDAGTKRRFNFTVNYALTLKIT